MRYCNIDVVKNVFLHKKYDGRFLSFNKNFRYIDKTFYSYNLELCRFDVNRNMWILTGACAKYNNFVSQTTSEHFLKVLRGIIDYTNDIDYCVLDKDGKLIERNGVKVLNDKSHLIKIIDITTDNKDIVCPISMEIITDKIYKTPCNHQFSYQLWNWIEKNNNCPLCRTLII
jgi:hypothetical protein